MLRAVRQAGQGRNPGHCLGLTPPSCPGGPAETLLDEEVAGGLLGN